MPALSQAAAQQGGAPAPAAPVAPQLAQAAAQAGAPAPGAGAPPPGAAGPPPGAPPPGAAPGAGAPPPRNAAGEMPGQRQVGSMPGGRRGRPTGGAQQVDPNASAIDGHMPPGMNEEQASPGEQAEYERAMRALSQVLYQNDKIAQAMVDQIIPDDKVGSTTKASLLLIQQLDEKLQMDESVVAQISVEVVERLSELAEARHNMQYGDRELQVIMGSVWEGVQQMFGMDEQGAETLVAGIGGEGVADLAQQHEAFYNG